MLHKLENAPGARSQRKRVGRGPGSTWGKTCGKGQKGQNSRSGGGVRIGFEGGQMPLHRRLPRRGFTNIFRKEYSIVNLQDIVGSKRLDINELIDVKALHAAGLIKSLKLPLKVLGGGDVTTALKIEAHKFSASAKTKIEGAGGEVKTLGGSEDA